MDDKYTFEIDIDVELCTGCGICIDVCPKDCFRISNSRNEQGMLPAEIVEASDCIGCELCELFCPELAIQLRDREEEDQS